jgi:hypothetical protein
LPARTCRRASRLTRAALAFVVLGTLAVATAIYQIGGAQPAGAAKALPTVTIKARDFEFVMPAKIPAGWTTIKLVNSGGEPHQAQLAKLNPGVTSSQIPAAGASGGDAAIVALLTAVGGPNAAAPLGGTSTTIVNLTPGQYVAICFIPSADGVRHYAKGMIQSFTVTKAKGKPLPAPKAKATVTLSDFTFGFPPTGLPANGVVAVKNTGAQDHEIALYQLAAGKTFDEAKAFLLTPPGAPPPAGPPPITEAGGLTGIAPGTTGYMKLALQPGTYVAACFLPDPTKGGLPHVIEGMLTTVTVG